MDSLGDERKYLHSLVDFSNKSVLEVGCGEGRLTWQFADKTKHVIAIDPDVEKIAVAKKNTSKELINQVEFFEGTILDFKLKKGLPKFDVVLLSWSLCCMEPEEMLPGLRKSYELLNKDGLLIDIHPYGESDYVEIHSNNKIWRAGKTQDKSNYLSYQQAHNALQEMIDQDIFIPQSECAFPILNTYDSISEFEKWIVENWNDTSIDNPTRDKARRLAKEIGIESQVVVREKISIASLRPNENYFYRN
jgi:ubiquinone/menaquinone biosynthesis C-methylase UbiE